jgi:hypothetical protein
VADINIKEIKLNNNKPKEKRSLSKSDNLSLDDIFKNNPHNIPEELLAEWKKSRKKPITLRVLNAFNKELSLILEYGMAPLDAVNKMLDKQWSTVELKFFANDISFAKNINTTHTQREKPGSSFSVFMKNNTGRVIDEHGNAVNSFC